MRGAAVLREHSNKCFSICCHFMGVIRLLRSVDLSWKGVCVADDFGIVLFM